MGSFPKPALHEQDWHLEQWTRNGLQRGEYKAMTRLTPRTVLGAGLISAAAFSTRNRAFALSPSLADIGSVAGKTRERQSRPRGRSSRFIPRSPKPPPSP